MERTWDDQICSYDKLEGRGGKRRNQLDKIWVIIRKANFSSILRPHKAMGRQHVFRMISTLQFEVLCGHAAKYKCLCLYFLCGVIGMNNRIQTAYLMGRPSFALLSHLGHVTYIAVTLRTLIQKVTSPKIAPQEGSSNLKQMSTAFGHRVNTCNLILRLKLIALGFIQYQLISTGFHILSLFPPSTAECFKFIFCTSNQFSGKLAVKPRA